MCFIKTHVKQCFDQKFQSDFKGRLWKVDVFGVKNLTRSLQYGNRYIYLLLIKAKGCTKKVDDKNTLKVLDITMNYDLN